MNSSDNLGDRMKEFYEKQSKTHLLRKVPVIVRIDGKCFSTFCKRFIKPFDEVLNSSLNKCMQNVCENVQGVKMGERHSDELSFLLTDYDTITTDAYFEYNVQKMVSVMASMVTSEFCRKLAKCSYKTPHFGNWIEKTYLDWDEKWPTFDARAFNLPENEIANYFWWRILDAKRNSISMWAQANFSHKQLQGVTSDQMQEMLFQEKGINWGNLPQGQKIGFICLKKQIEKPITEGPKEGEVVLRNVWTVDGSPSKKSELDEIINGLVLRKEE